MKSAEFQVLLAIAGRLARAELKDRLPMRDSKFQRFCNLVSTKCYFVKLWLADNALNIRKY
jgi:hypothetical protein